MAVTHLREDTGHTDWTTEKELLKSMLQILVSKGELSEDEERKAIQLLAAAGFRRG